MISIVHENFTSQFSLLGYTSSTICSWKMKHFTVTLVLSLLYLYLLLLKTGSLDNAIREFSLVQPSWYMSHYTMIYRDGERMRDFLGLFVFIVA